MLNCLILYAFAGPLCAQPNLAKLGPFVIGATTPDSVRRFAFREQELVVVKGTLALPCASIRVFKADTVPLNGISVSNLFLVFYDNRLFRITCDYKDSLQKKLTEQYGKGQAEAPKHLTVCQEEKSRRLTLERESWQENGIRAVVVRATGFNAECQPEQASRLTIIRQSLAAITSECDLEYLDPYVEKNWPER